MMMIPRSRGSRVVQMVACARPVVQRRGLRLLVGASAHPSPEKKESEDAWFTDGKRSLVGLADGVGGSRKEDVDPGAFSRRLMSYCARSAQAATPAEMLRAARHAVRDDDVAKRGGSATALVAQLREATLHVANFGDCAATLLRPTPRRFRREDGRANVILWPRAVMRTVEQTHFFNCPYQVSAEDDYDDSDDHVLGAAHVDLVAAEAKPGDVFVAATDGVWDNLDDVQVQHLIATKVHALWASAARHDAMVPKAELSGISEDSLAFDAPAEVLATIAEAIAAKAMEIGKSETAHTPFERAAISEGIADLTGGKQDDVTVVVGLVVPDEANFSALDEELRDNFGLYALPENGQSTAPEP